jgi:hypothetical protein
MLCSAKSNALIMTKWRTMPPDYRRIHEAAWLRVAAAYGCFSAMLNIIMTRDSDLSDAGRDDVSSLVPDGALEAAITHSAAEGSISVLRLAIEVSRRYVPGAIDRAWPEALGQAARAGRYEFVRYLYGLVADDRSFDLGAALVTLSQSGHEEAIDWLLSHSDRQRFDIGAACTAALESDQGAPALMALARHGAPVDLQLAFMTYAERGATVAVKFLCSTVAHLLDLEAALAVATDDAVMFDIIRCLPPTTDTVAMAQRMLRAGRRGAANALIVMHREPTTDAAPVHRD